MAATAVDRRPRRSALEFLLEMFVVLALLTMPSQIAVTWYGPEVVAIVSEETGADATPTLAVQVGGQYVELVLPGRFDQIAFALDNPLIALADLFAGLAVLVALLHLLVSRQWQRVALPPWPLWVLALALAVSGVSAGDLFAWGKELAQHLFYLLVAVALFAYLLHDEGVARRWIGLWVFVTVVAVGWGLAFDPESPNYLGGYLGAVYLPPAGAEDPLLVRAGFMSRTAYNGYLLLSLPIWYGFLLNARSWVAKLGWGLLLTLGLIPVLTLGAFLGLLLAFALVTALVSPPTLRTMVAAVALVAGFGLLAYFISTRHMEYLQASVAFRDERGEVTKRYLEWQASLHAFEASPLFGVGLGQYQESIGQSYYTLPNPEKMEPDTYNLYLLLLVQAGIMAPLAWFAVLFHGMTIARRAWQSPLAPYWVGLAKGAWAACFALLVFSFFGTVLVRGTGLAFAWLCAVLARLQREAARATAGEPPVAPVESRLPEDEWPVWAPATGVQEEETEETRVTSVTRGEEAEETVVMVSDVEEGATGQPVETFDSMAPESNEQEGGVPGAGDREEQESPEEEQPHEKPLEF